MVGVKAVVHLTGVGGQYALEDLFRVNARGVFDVFESARLVPCHGDFDRLNDVGAMALLRVRPPGNGMVTAIWHTFRL